MNEQLMKQNRWIVVTSIQAPTKAIRRLARLTSEGWSMVVVGDRKTPPGWQCNGITFLDIDEQKTLYPEMCQVLPYDHYARKNLGYLYAIQHGAELIVDTDDDNFPYSNFGANMSPMIDGEVVGGPGWVNIYSHFSNRRPLWPRGLPLDALNSTGQFIGRRRQLSCPIQQSLVDGDPDVDAIFRLVVGKNVRFRRRELPVVLEPGAWSPFNSQCTFFFKSAFPLLYLPSFVSFRMTDIWRSFVAQACLHHRGQSVAFLSPMAKQERNQHALMLDFRQEVPGYLHNDEIMHALAMTATSLPVSTNLWDQVLPMWTRMVDINVAPAGEIRLFKAWQRMAESLTR